VSNLDWTGVWQVVRRDGDQVARYGAEAMVTRDFMGPLGGFWSKLGRKRVTGWKYNIHVSLCTNYAVWKWMLKKNGRASLSSGTRANKQTNKIFLSKLIFFLLFLLLKCIFVGKDI
jgi:hypothetical protein